MGNFKMAQSALKKLFVYGTLKKGEPNHKWLTNGANGYAKFLCRATTSKKMPLVIATRYNIPFLLNKEGIGNYVAGEIYEVDDEMMKQCDVLEDCPNLYEREIQEMNIGIGEGSVPCWIYLLKKYPDHLLSLQMLSEYKDTKLQQYIERSKRTAKFSAKDDLSYKAAIIL